MSWTANFFCKPYDEYKKDSGLFDWLTVFLPAKTLGDGYHSEK